MNGTAYFFSLRVQPRRDEAPQLPQPHRQRQDDAAVGRDLQPGDEGVERAGEDELLRRPLGRRIVVEADQPADDLRGEDERERARHQDGDDRDDQAATQSPRCSTTVIRPSGLLSLSNAARGGSGRLSRGAGVGGAGFGRCRAAAVAFVVPVGGRGSAGARSAGACSAGGGLSGWARPGPSHASGLTGSGRRHRGVRCHGIGLRRSMGSGSDPGDSVADGASNSGDDVAELAAEVLLHALELAACPCRPGGRSRASFRGRRRATRPRGSRGSRPGRARASGFLSAGLTRRQPNPATAGSPAR